MAMKLDLSVLVGLTTEDELSGIVAEINESGILETELEVDTSDMTKAIGMFMSTLESLPEEKEDNIPDSASALYNKFSDELASLLAEKKKGESTKMAPKTEKQAPTKAETKKPVAKAPVPAAKAKPAPAPAAKAKPAKASNGEFREGTSAQAILLAVREAGKKGISKEQVIEKLDGKINTVSVQGRVKKILLSCVQKGLATRNDAGLYFPV